MKKQLLITLGLLVCICMQGQVGIGTNTPNPSSAIEIQSTTKGLLPPRMTEVQMNAISDPAEGLMVYCTDCITKGLLLYNATEWISISSSATPEAGLEIVSCIIEGTFMQNESSITRNLTVIYKQTTLASIGTLNFGTSNVTLSGVGATGLTVAASSPSSYTFAGLNDTIVVVYVISGVPITLGEVTASVDYASLAQCTSQTSVDIGTVTLDLSASINVISVASMQGVIDNTTNSKSHRIPYSGGMGVNSITFESVTNNGFTFNISNANINDNSGVLNVTLIASPSYNVPVQNVGVTSSLFAINVLSNGSIVGSITVNALGGHLDSNGVLYLEVVSNVTGETWLDRNLGASQVATSFTDHLAYGDFYQWGRGNDEHQTIGWTSNIASNGVEQVNETSTLANSTSPGHGNFIIDSTMPYDWMSNPDNALWQGLNGTNNPCPIGFRIPEVMEFINELPSSSSAFSGMLKLPRSGQRIPQTGQLTSLAGSGNYWSSSISTSNNLPQGVYFYSTSVNYNTFYRSSGLSVRCIKD